MDLVRSKCDLPTAASAAPNPAIVTGVSDAVGELGLEANVTGGRKLDACGAVHLVPCADRLLQNSYFVLLTSGKLHVHYVKKKKKDVSDLLTYFRENQ